MRFLNIGLFCFFLSLSTCSSIDHFVLDLDFEEDSLEVAIEVIPYSQWSLLDEIVVNQYAPLGLTHQSAAVFRDYALFVTNGRGQMLLYNLKKKETVYALDLPKVGGTTYHCNQSSFGVSKYDLSDPFPLLYVSQRANSKGRCFVEVFRIIPVWNDGIYEYESFSIEKVQTIYLPVMTYENSLGNANCTIDTANRWMYTYSRNNNASDDNFEKCKITKFAIPDIYESIIVLEDSDIVSSFMIDASALNMQGGCIEKDILYIGQGMASVGYIYLNIIDLQEQRLIRRIDLQEYGVDWEPEGCFFYDGSVMLSHSAAISRIDK